MRAIVTFLVFVISATQAVAEMPLGIQGAEFRLGAVQQDDGAAQGSLGPVKFPGNGPDITLGFAAVTVAITPYHGFQGDAVIEHGPDGAIGRIGGHLFMSPRDSQKFGLFGMLADVDGEDVTYAAAGVEGIIQLGPDLSLEARGGIGAANQQGLDFLFAGVRLSQDVMDGAATIYAGYDIAEFDEPAFSALGHEFSVGADVQLSNNTGAFVEVVSSRLTGASAAPAETIVRAGITVRLGRIGGSQPRLRKFNTADPVAQLVRRGFF